MRKLILVVVLALATTTGASAQKLLEYGLTAGINIPDYSTSTSNSDISNKLGWQGGLVIRIHTPVVTIQPELLFVHQSMNVRWENDQVRVKSNSLNMPVLASFTLLKILHLNAGPVFSLTNSCKYKFDGQKYDFGRLQPTIGYAIGAAVQIQHFLVDARFNGQFKNKQSVNEHGIDVDVKSYSVALSVGYLF
ncbi:MAG: porin family protein [Alistipes sp.]